MIAANKKRLVSLAQHFNLWLDQEFKQMKYQARQTKTAFLFQIFLLQPSHTFKFKLKFSGEQAELMKVKNPKL